MTVLPPVSSSAFPSTLKLHWTDKVEYKIVVPTAAKFAFTGVIIHLKGKATGWCVKLQSPRTTVVPGLKEALNLMDELAQEVKNVMRGKTPKPAKHQPTDLELIEQVRSDWEVILKEVFPPTVDDTTAQTVALKMSVPDKKDGTTEIPLKGPFSKIPWIQVKNIQLLEVLVGRSNGSTGDANQMFDFVAPELYKKSLMEETVAPIDPVYGTDLFKNARSQKISTSFLKATPTYSVDEAANKIFVKFDEKVTLPSDGSPLRNNARLVIEINPPPVIKNVKGTAGTAGGVAAKPEDLKLSAVVEDLKQFFTAVNLANNELVVSAVGEEGQTADSKSSKAAVKLPLQLWLEKTRRSFLCTSRLMKEISNSDHVLSQVHSKQAEISIPYFGRLLSGGKIKMPYSFIKGLARARIYVENNNQMLGSDSWAQTLGKEWIIMYPPFPPKDEADLSATDETVHMEWLDQYAATFVDAKKSLVFELKEQAKKDEFKSPAPPKFGTALFKFQLRVLLVDPAFKAVGTGALDLSGVEKGVMSLLNKRLKSLGMSGTLPAGGKSSIAQKFMKVITTVEGWNKEVNQKKHTENQSHWQDIENIRFSLEQLKSLIHKNEQTNPEWKTKKTFIYQYRVFTLDPKLVEVFESLANAHVVIEFNSTDIAGKGDLATSKELWAPCDPLTYQTVLKSNYVTPKELPGNTTKGEEGSQSSFSSMFGLRSLADPMQKAAPRPEVLAEAVLLHYRNASYDVICRVRCAVAFLAVNGITTPGEVADLDWAVLQEVPDFPIGLRNRLRYLAGVAAERGY
eukprot:CAMPEP_0177646698 /NCGR_PEP_ID=MMETSP0447-20121125/9908_1 /TAXON_ID=0 /ORGANISM="Stygamoeba regulata, Strain BSH-02190019" /LENGTH=794 /DNA_ID=CAMNT_0019149239 /DNA_START=49 /DNA_END=2433 /DNA_ORIENTATION=+